MVIYSDLNILYNEDITIMNNMIEKLHSLNITRIAINININLDILGSKNKNIEKEIQIITNLKKQYHKLHILSRVTIITSSKNNIQNYLDKLSSQGCDILAFTPTTQDAFILGCNSLNIDIISFHSDSFFNLKFGHHLTTAIIHREILVELCYSNQSLFIISSAMYLLRHCRHNKFIISSGASESFQLLGIYDILNLAYVFGLKRNVALATITQNCKNVCNHSYSRNHTIKGVFEINKLSQITNSERIVLKLDSKNNISSTTLSLSSSNKNINRKRKANNNIDAEKINNVK